MTDRLEIFTTIDSDWLDYAWMFIASVRQTTKSRVCYTILLDSKSDSLEFESWAADNDVELRLIEFSAALEADSEGVLGALPAPPDPYSPCAYWGRYCAAYVLDAVPERLIYADVDMLAVADLAPLMTIGLDGAPVGAVGFPLAEVVEKVGLSSGNYVNNGLLVFDTGAFDGLACVLSMHRAIEDRATVFGPQCGFNIAMDGRVKILDSVWNVQGELRERHRLDAKLIHFTGNVKPWHTLSVDPLRWRVKRVLNSIGREHAWQPDWSLRKYCRSVAGGVLRALRVR